MISINKKMGSREEGALGLAEGLHQQRGVCERGRTHCWCAWCWRGLFSEKKIGSFSSWVCFEKGLGNNEY